MHHTKLKYVFIIAVRNFICGFALLALLPMFMLVAILIYFEDGRPIIFRQQRIGVSKKNFTIYKFRTMKNNAPELGTHEIKKNFKLKCGLIIRRLKLDEFPQLLNVLKNDLNIVGPRPGLVSQIALAEARQKKDIFSIKPGITGLSQILGYDMSDPVKLSDVDDIYKKNMSLFLDIKIIAGTFWGFPRKLLASQFKIKNLR